MNGSSSISHRVHWCRGQHRKALHLLVSIVSCLTFALANFLLGSIAQGVEPTSPPAATPAATSAATPSSLSTAKPATTPEQIIREYRYDANQGAPVIEQRISDEEGTTYVLKEVSDPAEALGAAPLRQFTATAQRPITLEQESQGEAAVRGLFAEALSINTGDYAGLLYIQSLTTEPVYRSVEEQIERTVVYPNLVSEDVLQLPEHEEFTITSDEGLDATVVQELRRVAVSWQTTGFDEDGRPALYEASVIFRGVQRQLVLDYHLVTAVYAGMVPVISRMESVFATYETEPTIAPVTLNAAILPLPEMAVPLGAAAPQLSLALIAGAVVAVMLLALLGFLYFFLYRNARLVRVSATGRRRVLVRKHLRLEKGEAVFKIDPSQGLYRETVRHLIILNRPLASRQGYLTVLWGDRLILRVSLKQETDVTGELVRAVEGELDTIIWEGVAAEYQLLGEEA
ncbi:MAG: hypothetical protein LBP24_04730 [Coriobacteriales bacterium]|nr:hypothetical protein [Coriobacteriales bacterium]